MQGDPVNREGTRSQGLEKANYDFLEKSGRKRKEKVLGQEVKTRGNREGKTKVTQPGGTQNKWCPSCIWWEHREYERLAGAEIPFILPKAKHLFPQIKLNWKLLNKHQKATSLNRVSTSPYWSSDTWKNGKGKTYFCVCVWMPNYDEYSGFKCFVLTEWSCLLCTKPLSFSASIRCPWTGKHTDLRKKSLLYKTNAWWDNRKS